MQILCRVEADSIEKSKMADVPEENRKIKADEKIASGSDDSRHATDTKERKSHTTVFDLNLECWTMIMDYQCVEDQLSLACSNVWIEQMFKEYARYRHKHIDYKVMSHFDEDDGEKLLKMIGEHVVSYDSSRNPKAIQYCPNLQHLLMEFKSDNECGPGEFEWGLHSLKKLQTFSADLNNKFNADVLSAKIVDSLKECTSLRKLQIRAFFFNGIGLHRLDQLEYLDLLIYDGVEAKSLRAICQSMKQLRRLEIKTHVNKMNKKTLEILAENCKQLECLILGGNIVNLRWPYELICQLPRLRHLQVHYRKGLRHELIEGLVNKKDSHLESLILKGCALSLQQVQHICKISTLKELHVPSKIVPLADLQKLTNLLYLHITMPDMGPNQDLDLKKALPRVQASVTEQKEHLGFAYSYVNIPPTLMNRKKVGLDWTRPRLEHKLKFGFP